MTDLRQTVNYASYLRLQGWIVERVNSVNYFIKKIPIIGSVLKVQRPNKIDTTSMNRIIEKYHCFQISVEPNLSTSVGSILKNNHNLLLSHGFKLSRSPYLPTKTLQIDLTQSLANIHKKFKRNIRKGIAMGESFKTKVYSSPKELEIFQKAWKKSVEFSRHVPAVNDLLNLQKSFTNNNSLFLASHNISGNIIGGVIFTKVSHESVHYMYGFTSKEGRASLTHAALLYQGILWGKRNNCKIFDFEGIYDNRFPNKSWLGFTQFKKSFGGFEVTYPGCYIKYNPKNVFPFLSPQTSSFK